MGPPSSAGGGPLPPPPWSPFPYPAPYTPPGFSENADAQRALRSKADLWFVLSLATIPCCCLFGFAGAFFAYQAKDLIAAQRLEDAERSIRTARLVTLTTVAFTTLIVAGWAALLLASFLKGAPVHFRYP